MSAVRSRLSESEQQLDRNDNTWHQQFMMARNRANNFMSAKWRQQCMVAKSQNSRPRNRKIAPTIHDDKSAEGSIYSLLLHHQMRATIPHHHITIRLRKFMHVNLRVPLKLSMRHVSIASKCQCLAVSNDLQCDLHF